jgi:hypothetical protein
MIWLSLEISEDWEVCEIARAAFLGPGKLEAGNSFLPKYTAAQVI